MTISPSILLDTSIVLHYSRRSAVFDAIEARYQLTQSRFQPLVCVVTLGEIRALAYYRAWGDARLKSLDAFLSSLVCIDINDPRVIEAYARLSAHASLKGWALHSQKNDLWIAATAQVCGARLLTTDKDFADARSAFIDCEIYDNLSGATLP